MSKPRFYDPEEMLKVMQREVNSISKRLMDLPESTERLALQYCIGALQTSMYRIQHEDDK